MQSRLGYILSQQCTGPLHLTYMQAETPAGRNVRDSNARGVAKYSDVGPIEMMRKRCKTGGKLVLITNRKSHMSFRLVQKSVTLNDVEQHNGRYFALFQRNR